MNIPSQLFLQFYKPQLHKNASESSKAGKKALTLSMANSEDPAEGNENNSFQMNADDDVFKKKKNKAKDDKSLK